MSKKTLSLLLFSLGLLSINAWPAAVSLRDPTRPLGHYSVSKTATQKLQLNSILISSERKLAIINGQQLRENDVIKDSAGIRVKRIQANEVVLQQGEKTWRLSLNAMSVRQ